MEKFTLSLPLSGEYLTTVRLTTGGLCSLAGFDVDSAEDFKVCVTESLLILKRNGFSRAVIEFGVGGDGEALACTVCGDGEEHPGQRDADGEEISYALLGALLGDVRFSRTESGLVRCISFNA